MRRSYDALVTGLHDSTHSDGDEEYAMALVVNLPKQDKPHRNDVLVAAGQAVVATVLDPRAADNPEFACWYGKRIRKITRRARNIAWERVQDVPGVTVTHGTASVRAFVPAPVQATDPRVDKLQIGGTDLPFDEYQGSSQGICGVFIDTSLKMSLGKATAQVGHATMLFAASRPYSEVEAWATAGFPLTVREVSHEEFIAEASRADALVVHDAGFTEVAPGSATVVAVPRGADT
ncbi:aminoacyl-tRNA hydrolase [Corynebacterium glucuronolyticum]|uniref:aminoacyl-tRNA hydrolase n=1 Tax=Corynebacterium glucuronolyticum TaxID=39791 RepID=UPI00223B8070|nr:peptidyl-tRNA hydrolase [Corynebacterium glucuronolyticum]MCT1442141.1 hypothetical protein [Corynebacterium glucuronolyticum]